jgi:nicotinate-nucleotide adenylyltransferase
MTSREPVGILGGTFDPIHRGHLGVAEAVRQALSLSRILLVPARVPPHRTSPLVSIYHRFAMVAIAAMTDESLVASDFDLDSFEPSYTWTLLDRFDAQGYTASQMVFITGADAFAEIASWRHYPDILDRCHFAVVSRPGLAAPSLAERMPALASRVIDVGRAQGMDTARGVALPADPRILLIDAATPDVSSTEIRSRARAGEPLSDLLPDGVAAYVRRHGLYVDA